MRSACLLLLAMTGCADPWPQPGRGGMAERLPVADAALAQADGDLAVLAARRAEPGRVAMARERLVRAQREHEGGLLRDAETSLGDVLRLAGLPGARAGRFPPRPACKTPPCG